MNHKKTMFRSLSPVDDIAENSSFKALDLAIKDPSVFNIAVTGPFGSGKSSFIKSYIKRNRTSKNCIDISLASFSDGKQKKQENRKIQDIEYSILQKLLLKDISKVSQGEQWNFTINFIEALKSWKLFVLSILIIAISYYPLKNYIDYFTTAYSLYFSNAMNWELTARCKDLLRIPPFFILSYSLNIVILWIYHLLGKVSKISTPVGEIEIDKDSNLSLIDSNMENIVNFFQEHKNYQYVILEDFDRLESSFIYTKLRELNQLLNNCDSISRKITFIYAVRDDLFTGEERTKFFDFLVPIIPLVNPTSSFDFIIKEYANSKDEIFKMENRDFLQDVFLYINNARNVFNIINEYLVYSKELKGDLNCKKLFSIIIYKNFFPKDFDDLHINKGAFYNLIYNEKSEFKKACKITFEKKIEDTKKLLKEGELEVLQNIEDLRRTFLSKISEQTNHTIRGNLYSNYIKNTSDQFHHLLTSRKINVINGQLNKSQPINIPQEIVNEYIKRERIILNKGDQEKESYHKEIADLSDKITQIDTSSLKILLNEHDFGLNTLLKKHKNIVNVDEYSIDLFAFLIRDGLLDENYHYYISHFFEGFITQNDRDFLLSIKNQRYLGPSYNLDNPKAIINRINLHEWRRPEVMNNSIIDYLIDSSSDQIFFILEQIAKSKNDNFLEQYNLTIKKKTIIYPWLMNNWGAFAEKILNIYGYDAFYDLVIFLSSSRLKLSSNLEERNLEVIRNVISNLENLNILSYARNYKSLKDVSIFFKDYKISFSSVSDYLEDRNIQFLLENYLYDINRIMICLILSYYENKPVNLDRQDFLTAIDKSGDDALIQMVNTNKEKVANILIEGNTIAEKEETLVSFINDLALEYSKEIISKLPNYFIRNLKSFNEEYYKIILELNKLFPNIENIHVLFNVESMLESEIIKFLNADRTSKLMTDSFENIEKKHPYIEDIKRIIDLSLIKDSMPFDLYKKIIIMYPFYILPDWENTSDEKISYLIEIRKIQFNQENFDSLEENSYVDNSLKLLDMNFDNYEEVQVNLEIIKNYLQYNKFDVDKKKRLFNTYFSNLNSETYYNFIIDFVLEYKYTGKMAFFSNLWGRIDKTELKLNFLILQEEHIKDQLINYVHNLGGIYKSLALHDRKQPKLPATVQNRELIKILKIRNHISSYKEETGIISSFIRVHNGG